jgi:hypothetical protein
MSSGNRKNRKNRNRASGRANTNRARTGQARSLEEMTQMLVNLTRLARLTDAEVVVVSQQLATDPALEAAMGRVAEALNQQEGEFYTPVPDAPGHLGDTFTVEFSRTITALMLFDLDPAVTQAVVDAVRKATHARDGRPCIHGYDLAALTDADMGDVYAVLVDVGDAAWEALDDAIAAIGQDPDDSSISDEDARALVTRLRFHPDPDVRQALTEAVSTVLHAEEDERDRLECEAHPGENSIDAALAEDHVGRLVAERLADRPEALAWPAAHVAEFYDSLDPEFAEEVRESGGTERLAVLSGMRARWEDLEFADRRLVLAALTEGIWIHPEGDVTADRIEIRWREMPEGGDR